MKISRQKKINKYLNFFINNYGFRAPFQILIDGTYCFAALKNQHNIQEVLPKYFQSELKLLTTPCVAIETEQLGSKVIGASIIIKKFAIHKCAHGAKPISGSKCIKSMIGKRNSNRYIVATQDRDLQEYIRSKPGVPLLYLHQKTPVLENPSTKTVDTSKLNIMKRFQLNENDTEMLNELKMKNGLIQNDIKTIQHNKKRKGGPNPLSCKKKKPVLNQNNIQRNMENKIEKRRKRKRIRVPDHVKQELLQIK